MAAGDRLKRTKSENRDDETDKKGGEKVATVGAKCFFETAKSKKASGKASYCFSFRVF